MTIYANYSHSTSRAVSKMFKYTLCKEQSMNLGISILVIAFAIASIGLAPSLMISQSASAVSHW
jgi:hypothetical protein